MKRFIILMAITLRLCYAQAQEPDTLLLEDSIITEDVTEIEEEAFSLQNNEIVTNNLKIKHHFGLGVILWGQDEFERESSEDLNFEGKESSNIFDPSNNYGFSLEYKLSFTPIQEKDGLTIKNPCNLGYTTGLIFSGDFAKANDGTKFSWDVLASGGIYLGYSKIGVDIDALIGLGGDNGYYLLVPLSAPENASYEAANKVVFKYGFQIAFKINTLNEGILGSIFNVLSTIGGDASELSLFARFLLSTSPKDLSTSTDVQVPIFSKQAIFVGVKLTF